MKKKKPTKIYFTKYSTRLVKYELEYETRRNVIRRLYTSEKYTFNLYKKFSLLRKPCKLFIHKGYKRDLVMQITGK
jgi:hypothetical protein